MPLTCGSNQASRLGWLEGDTYIFASGTSVFSFEFGGIAPKRSRGVASPTLQEPLAADYIVPYEGRARNVNPLRAHSTHRLEIQCVATATGRIATADAAGRTFVSTTNSRSASIATPNDRSPAPPGFAAVALSHTSATLLAVARGPARDLALYDDSVLLRRYHTVFTPAALAFRDQNVVVLADGPVVALYDIRNRRAKPALSRRVCDGATVLRALALSNEAILVAAADRAVIALDPHTLAPRGRWAPCLKYEPAAIIPASNGIAAAASVDNEVAVGAWDNRDLNTAAPRSHMLSGAAAVAGGARRMCGFRADVRLVGLARNGEGAVTALSESGAAYELRTS